MEPSGSTRRRGFQVIQSVVRAALCLSMMVLSAGTTLSAERPNVLLIIADDLGMQLSCYGDQHIETPNIDAIAASGTRFKTAYIAQASCSPSRVSIYTGLFPHTHGHIGLAKPTNPPLRSEFHNQTLPKLMKSAGYRTGIIGKLHVNPKSAFKFDLYRNADLGPNNGREVRAMAEAADEFIHAESSKPFLLVMSYVDPHHPFAVQMDGMPKKPTLPGEVPAWPFQQIESDDLLEEAANYYNCVRRLDWGVGMLMEKLRAAGKDENTVIIFLGDHGPPFVRAKTTCYEAGLRVPFIVRWPGVSKPGLFSEAFVSSVDILPTILDAIGEEIPAHIQGRSLRTVASGNNTGWRDVLAGEFHQHTERPFFPRRALRDARYKVIHNLLAGKLTIRIGIDGDLAHEVVRTEAYGGSAVQKAMTLQADPPEWELYDLEADPWEFNNLAAAPAHAEALKRMQRLLFDWRKDTNDPFLDGATLAKKHADVNARGETISLFDGKTLDGWVTLDGKPITKGWEVVDGVIHLKIEKDRPGHIRTTRTFENFELEFEWRVAEGGNSGVKYLVKESQSDLGLRYFGCEYQLLDDDNHKNGRTPTKTAGALYELYAPLPDFKRLRPLGEFNHSRIVVDNGRIEHWLNGRRILKATIGSKDWQAKIDDSKFSSVKDFASGPGAIMLQEHLSEAWFRKILLTPLP